MNKLKIIIALISLVFLIIGMPSCVKEIVNEQGIETTADLVIPDGFLFNTADNVDIIIHTRANTNEVVPFVPIEIYTDLPENGGKLLLKGVTNDQGTFSSVHPLPGYIDEVVITTQWLGLPDYIVTAVDNHQIIAKLGGARDMKSGGLIVPFKSTNALLQPMGDYDENGVPEYLVNPGDVVDAGLLALVNNNLPEQLALPDNHPEWILADINYDFELEELCDVWITYIDEGAGWKNVLGFYTYDAANPPASKDDIELINIIFPNVSNVGSGGGLLAGDKVFLGEFEAGTNIGLVLLANGWSQSSQTVGFGTHQVYSNPNFNPQADPEQQFVMLYDDIRELVLIGIEDQKRPGGDQDFNDAVFYLTSNPVTAIDDEEYPDPNPIEDEDEDGVPDDVDEYPTDPERAFNVYYPGENQFGTLAFEDLWPSKGDYDFNDMVVDYNIHHVTNASNNVVDVNGTYKLRAMGAGFENGFGFQLEITPDQIEGINFTYEDASVQAVNPESGQSKAVIILWENGFDLLPHQGNGAIGVNTTLNIPPTKEFYTLEVAISTPSGNRVPLADFGVPPYNSFVPIDQDRSREVHLSDNVPTDLADGSLFGTFDDVSVPIDGIYYKADNNMPWGIHIIESFDYPVEKIKIMDAYLHFADWASSAGVNYPDWYKDEPGYRNAGNVYP